MGDSQSHAEPRSHRDGLAPAGENDNDCMLTGGDHLMGKYDVKSSVTDGGSRQWKQIEQLKTIAIGLLLILAPGDSWVNGSSIVIRTFRMKWSVSFSLQALLEIIMW